MNMGQENYENGGAHQRKTERLAWEESVEFLSPVHCVGQTLDIGAGGLGVEMEKKLSVGAGVEIKILHGRLIAYGQVRWVKPMENGLYRAGIQFTHEDWSIITHIREMLRMNQ